MKKSSLFSRVLILILSLSLSLPMSVFADKKVDTKKAKKNFNEGIKYEVDEKWDLAFQSFLLAIANDPGNAEYRVHLIRCTQNASQMFMKRGATFEAEGDYASAYTAFQQAATYDQNNEIAPIKMKRMIELQKAQAGLGEAPKYNASTGNIIAASVDLTPAQKYQSRSKDVASVVKYEKTNLKLVIGSIAKQLGLNVIFDETVRDQPNFSVEFQNTTLARALDFIFIQNKLTFEQLDRRTLLVYLDNPNNRQRFERLMVKTFYVSNTKLEEARTVVQTMLQGGGSGLNRQIAMSAQLNALIVRAPIEDLKMVQQVLDSIDKNRAEVSIDVEIFEVTHNTSNQIGNQIATQPQTLFTPVTTTDRTTGRSVTSYSSSQSSTLGNLGGILGQGLTNAVLGNVIGVGSGFGALLAAPPTTLTLLQSKNNAKSVGRVNVHAIDGQSNKTNVGKRVPVNLGISVPSYGAATTPTQGGIGTGIGAGGSNGFGFSSFQYQDVGLNIDITPTVTNEGYIEMKMTLESSGVVPGSGGVNQTPEFTQRKLTTISRVLDGKTAVVAGVQQENKGDSRSSIPFFGMIPILGRFITTPTVNNDNSDIIITVTPHIIRAPQIEKKDHQAVESGTGLGGNFLSIEQIVMRAQDEDDQDRRIIAAQKGQPLPETTLEAKAPASVPQPTVITNAVTTPNNTAPTVIRTASNPQAAVTNNAISNANTDSNDPPADYDPPPNSNPQIRPAIMTPEQIKARAEIRTRMQENPVREQAIPVSNEPPLYEGPKSAPIIAPKRPVKPEKDAQSAQSEPKEMSKLKKSEAIPEKSPGAAEASEPTIGLSLKLSDKKPQVGESFIVVLAVDGKSKMTGANVALNYDPALLQLKSVRDGGLLGKNPDITQLEKNGNLLVTMQQSNDKGTPLEASGKLLILEFKALGAGQAMIAFNADETKFTFGNKQTPLFSISPAQFEIATRLISKLTK